MPLGRRQRKLLLILCLGLAGLLLLWLFMPVWFPWVLQRLAGKYGVRFARYQRQAQGRVELDRVTFTNQTVRLSAEHVEIPGPGYWLSRFLSGKPERERLVRIHDWRVEVVPGPTKSTLSVSTYTNFQTIEGTVQEVLSWVPAAEFFHGEVHLRGVNFTLPTASCAGGIFRATTTWPQLPEAMRGWAAKVPAIQLQPALTSAVPDLNITAILTNSRLHQVHFDSRLLQLAGNVELTKVQSGLRLHGNGTWSSNRFEMEAEFGASGALPARASLQSAEFHIAPGALRLGPYADLSGSIKGHWEAGQFALDLSAKGTGSLEATNLSPLQLDLHTTGDTNFVILHSAAVSSPFLQAQLSKDATFYFTGELLRSPARFNLVFDLSRQHWLDLSGVFKGEADFTPGEKRFPLARFRLVGSKVGTMSSRAETILLEGNFAWPWLEIDQGRVVFEEGSMAEVVGKMDLESRSLADSQVRFEGKLPRCWLPPGYSYETLALTAAFSGPLNKLRHSGHVELAGVTTPATAPMLLTLNWAGQATRFEHADFEAIAGTSTLTAEAVAEVHSGITGTMRTLTLSRAAQPVLALANGMDFSFMGRNSNSWRAQFGSWDWGGPSGGLQAKASVEWPQQGLVQVMVQQLRSDLWADFLRPTSEAIQVDSLKVQAGWSNGPISFVATGSASMQPRHDLPLSAMLIANGNPQGITLSNLTITSHTSAVAVAHGFLPLTLNPADRAEMISLHADTPFQFTAATEPQSAFWEKIASWTGLSFIAPNIRATISGTWREPRGVIQVQAAQIRWIRGEEGIPPLDDVDVSIRLDRRLLSLNRCQFLVLGQPVQLTGGLPNVVSSGHWALPDWKQAQAHLRIQDAQVAGFAAMFPKFLNPQGELDLDVDVQPGPVFAGELELRHARSRPLPTVGPIRDIQLKVQFQNQTLQIKTASADIGGVPIEVVGSADLKAIDWRKPVIPAFVVTLRGTNVPLSRQPESIIRSDLDVVIRKTNDRPALLSGTAHLRDSYYLHDFGDLIPGKVATPSRRPPYFSIDVDPIADWQLAVHVTGERFLKVRSTLFNGEVSANLNLQGTLKEPIALGDVRIDSGFVRFPFATLQVQQGFVTLTSQEPYRPQVLVSAASKQFGYDLKMDVSGPADAPILQFTSTPPLSSEQIVLMMTAGQLPRDTRSLSTQQRAQTLAVFVGRDLLTRLGFGTEGQQHLTIHSGEQLSEEGRPTYNVEYQLSDRWSLVGEYDRFNAFNAGLKWRVYSK